MRGRAGRLAGVLLVALGGWVSLATAGPPDTPWEIGRRIYEQGVLPDGTPLKALRPEGFSLEGEQAACIGCHRRSGMGSVEGLTTNSILVPPVAGPVLFAPARFHGVFLDSTHHWVPNDAWRRALTRPAYDRPALARALREGLDPGGTILVAPMPRYDLDERAVAALAAYLDRLTADPSPGVEPETLHLATVTAPDVEPRRAEAVLGVLESWIRGARILGKRWQLQVWRLAGPPEGWEAQLASYQRERPVFALLSGVGGARWEPIHRFCENQRLACVLPSVEVAPRAKGDFYSVYFSPGVPLEARVLAAYLAANGGVGELFQVSADPVGNEAADTLAAALGDPGPARRVFRPEDPTAVLEGTGPDASLVLWLRPEEIHRVVEALPAGPPVAAVYLSALLAPPGALDLPPAWRERVRFVSLFDDLGVQADIAKVRLRRWLERAGLGSAADLRLQADAYAACYLFGSALSAIKGQEVRRPEVPLTREHLLETLENLVEKYSDGTAQVDPDSHVAFYGRMSLGPRQRVAVRGGVLLRYATADSGRLAPASERIVP